MGVEGLIQFSVFPLLTSKCFSSKVCMLTAEPNGDLSEELHLQNGQMKFALLISVKVMVLFNKKRTNHQRFYFHCCWLCCGAHKKQL